jgi:hypothetical protein
MALICTSPPLVNPVSIQELKSMLRIDQGDTTQDDVLTSLNVAATSMCESIAQRKLVQQSWTLMTDFFPGYVDWKMIGQKISSPFVSGSNAVMVGIRYAFLLPFPPVQTLNTFVYLNANGQTTSMITGPFNIASVTNTLNQPVQIVTAEPHGLESNASVTISGNTALIALCSGVANQQINVLDDVTLLLPYVTGTGSSITATGQVTGFNFVEDLESQPARLMPIFGQMWPVARVIANAVQINFTLGYASPVQVTTSANSATLGTATFTAVNIGQPISIPGAGPGGATLNTIIQSVSGGVGTMRDVATTAIAQPSTALLVNYGSPQHWELAKTAIKFLVNSWFVNRLPSYDSATRDCVKAILGPVMDYRY